MPTPSFLGWRIQSEYAFDVHSDLTRRGHTAGVKYDVLALDHKSCKQIGEFTPNALRYDFYAVD